MKDRSRVHKFRSAEQMQNTPPDADGSSDFERFLRHCARYRALAPRVYPRGVFRFRTIEDAQRARDTHAKRS